jgi:hypothetical protein
MAVMMRLASLAVRSASSSSSIRTSCCDRATTRVFFVVGRETLSSPRFDTPMAESMAVSCAPAPSSPIAATSRHSAPAATTF